MILEKPFPRFPALCWPASEGGPLQRIDPLVCFSETWQRTFFTSQECEMAEENPPIGMDSRSDVSELQENPETGQRAEERTGEVGKRKAGALALACEGEAGMRDSQRPVIYFNRDRRSG